MNNINYDGDAESIGSSILSNYEYGQTSDCENISDFYDSDRDPEYTPNKEPEDLGTINNKKRKRKITSKNKLTRKRTRNTTDWKDNKAKQLLNLGKEHTNRAGKLINAKKMGAPCECRNKCFEKINERTRKRIFDEYWSLGDHSMQWDFVARYVVISDKKVSTNSSSNSRRQFSRKYYLPIQNNGTVSVCKVMFLKTIGISEKIVNNMGKKLALSSVLMSDQRGTHSNRPHAIPREVTDCIKQHISMFPVFELRCTQQNTQKQYLQSDLSIAKMYRFYQEWVKEESINVMAQNATLRQYTDIFNNSFNLSFFKPKRDLCDDCEKFKLASPEEKYLQKTIHAEHLKNKDIARDKKDIDKKRTVNEPELCVAVFDLQKVLTPQSEASSFYYKRRFSVYNFTIFDIGKRLGYCYVWNESEAKRGSNEIGTCLLKFMKCMVEKGIKEFCFYSDNCRGRNRNRIIFAMWEYAAFTLKVKITHRFLEKGHTQNEGDSMYACIKNASKGKFIYVPCQWVTMISCAKVTGKPYTVTEVSNEEILDFKPLVYNKQCNWKTASDGSVIRWTNIRELTANFENPFQLELKYDLCALETIKINITHLKENLRGRHQPRCKPIRAYHQKLAIDKLKTADLLSLCSMGLVPSTYHDFYKSLQSK